MVFRCRHEWCCASEATEAPAVHQLSQCDYLTFALSNPSVIIDRRSGVVEIEGIDGFTFSGDCRPKEVGAGERQF